MSIYYLYPPPSRYPTTSIRGHTFPTAAAAAGSRNNHHHHNNPLQPLLHVLHDLAHPAAAAHDVRAPAVDIRETATRYYIDVELPGVAPSDYSVRWTDEEGGSGGRLLLVEAELRRRRVPEEEEEKNGQHGEGEEGESGGPEEDLGCSLHRVPSHDGDDLYVAVSSGSDDEERAGAVPPVTPAKKARTQSLSAAWTAVRPRAFLLHHAATTGPPPRGAASSSAASSSPPHPSSTTPPKKQHQHQPDPSPRVRCLARERRVGTFARAFRFHAAVDRAGLRARLDQGVLSLVVPKKEEEEEVVAGQKSNKGTATTAAAGGVDSVAVRRRRPKEAGDGSSGGGRRGSNSILHGAHHWTLAWPGPARNRVVGPRDWSPGLMNSPGYFM